MFCLKDKFAKHLNLVWLVCAHSMLTVPPAVVLRMSISSRVPLVRDKTNRQPLAEPESENAQRRETVVLKKVILALWTSLVTVTEGKGIKYI